MQSNTLHCGVDRPCCNAPATARLGIAEECAMRAGGGLGRAFIHSPNPFVPNALAENRRGLLLDND